MLKCSFPCGFLGRPKRAQSSKEKPKTITKSEEEVVILGMVTVSETDEEDEAFDEYADDLRRNPREQPNNHTSVRFRTESPGILVPRNNDFNTYYPALSELPEKFPVELVSEDERKGYSKFYDKFKHALHYAGEFTVNVPKGGRVQECVEKDICMRVEQVCRNIRITCGHCAVMHLGKYPKLDPKLLPYVEEEEYNKLARPPLAHEPEEE